jgi:5-methylcytosine-specific restriction endonuclease McrA
MERELGIGAQEAGVMARKPQYSGPWKKVRAEVLLRDDNRCQIRAAGCTQVAVEVDHILPVSMGGEWYELDNLRAACSRCNNGRNMKHKTTSSRAW